MGKYGISLFNIKKIFIAASSAKKSTFVEKSSRLLTKKAAMKQKKYPTL
jgi:hypothetical protein